MKKSGFTLIELMIIIAIIAILAAIAIPNFNRVREKSAIHATAATLKAVLKALEAYASAELEFSYPQNVDELIDVIIPYLEIDRVSETVEMLGFEGTPTGSYTIAAKVRAISKDTWALYTDTMKSPRFVTTEPVIASWKEL